MIHHSNEQVEQDNDVDHGKRSEHEQSEKPGEFFDARQLEIVQVNQAKNSPEQGL